MFEKIVTKDGSTTLFSYNVQECYRSLHGAASESRYVFVESGLVKRYQGEPSLSILEIGFGTGLNCLQTVLQDLPCKIEYTSLDFNPPPLDILREMNFSALAPTAQKTYEAIISAPWDEKVSLTESFSLLKVQQSFKEFYCTEKFDVIYFDPFAPSTQPASWEEEMFTKVRSLSNPGAVLVTYSCKGSIRRMLEGMGFTVEKLPGPPGKNQMLRATL